MTNDMFGAAANLVREANETHRACCTCCQVCQQCGYPCLPTRLAIALRSLIEPSKL